ncbi:hypothetical protein KCP76_03255 [Salmonella enterica subsp. enterica serovar Weltevreden]|nr:hypothetical protein KCP76_03255 [Salmonella enterica subsp. enterica serovar Weltevreden]
MTYHPGWAVDAGRRRGQKPALTGVPPGSRSVRLTGGFTAGGTRLCCRSGDRFARARF